MAHHRSGNGSGNRVEHTQNYLHSRKLVAQLVGSADISESDVVLEIGPGRGIITEALAARCAHVIAVEKDAGTTSLLQDRFGGNHRVTVFAADILDFPMPATEYKVFANIPFNITAAIVGKLTTGTAPPRLSYLVMQAEAAARFIGSPRTTLSSALLYPGFEIAIAHRFDRHDFRPAPAVDTVLVRIGTRQPPLVGMEHIQHYRDFVTTLFTAWKPNVQEALRSIFTRAVAAGITQRMLDVCYRKPGELSHEEWLELFQSALEVLDPSAWSRIDGAETRLLQQQQRLQKHHRSRASGRR
jgi:23S rRNA (adenine-N6)-dimethyltransferase